MVTGRQKSLDVKKRRLHKQLQMSSVELVVVLNRICDRHEAKMRISTGDFGMARRMLQFIEEDLQKIEDTTWTEE
jgi:hypothetical protein